jgi:hypothetical protein
LNIIVQIRQGADAPLTVLNPYLCKDNVALLVHLDTSNTIFLPLAEKNSNLLSGTFPRDRHADITCGWLDPEEACEPVLLDLDAAIATGVGASLSLPRLDSLTVQDFTTLRWIIIYSMLDFDNEYRFWIELACNRHPELGASVFLEEWEGKALLLGGNTARSNISFISI